MLSVFRENDSSSALISTALMLEVESIMSELGVIIANESYSATNKPKIAPMLDGLSVSEQFILDENYPNYLRLRSKYLSEHSLKKDECYWLISGQCLVSFHRNHKVYQLLMGSGDVVRIPANTLYWVDFGPSPKLIAMKYMSSGIHLPMSYTGSNIADSFPLLSSSL